MEGHVQCCKREQQQQNEIPIGGFALGRARTRGTDLYQARGQPDTPPGRQVLYVPVSDSV